jgi:hypothetical protein
MGANKFLAVLLTIGVFTLMSCSRLFDNAEIIKGFVVSLNGESVVEGCELRLIETQIPFMPFSLVSEYEVESASTNSDGYFELEYDLKERSKYEYRVEFHCEEDTFWSLSSFRELVVDNIKLQEKEDQILIFKVARGAAIRIHLFSDKQFSNEDVIRVYINDGYSFQTYGYYSGAMGYDLNNYNELRRDYMPVLAGDLEIQTHLTRNGITEVFSQFISIAQNEKRTIDLHI